MYKIRGSDQKEYGPASADQIRQWLAEGRVAAQTQLQQEGSNEWKPLSEFPEFTAMPGLEPPPVLASPSSGLGITSMVLGILSLIGCTILTGIPAIITGHIAYARSRRNPQRFGGRGFGIAGFVMGYMSLVLIPIYAALLLPALAKAKAQAQHVQCINNLKQIGLAARIWSSNRGEQFPPDFESMSGELGSPRILVCPGDGSKTPAMDWMTFGPGNVSYEFVEPNFDGKAGEQQTVIFRCPIHGSVGLADGSVQGGQGMGFRKQQPMAKEEIVGIGAALRRDEQFGELQIMKVVPNSPAARAGLASGQIIQKIDDVETTALGLSESVNLVRGAVGTTVRLVIVDPTKDTTNMVSLTREKIAFQP